MKRDLEDDLLNTVVSALQTPPERTNVAEEYANDKNLATEIQAYAKIAGRDWTFYVKSLSVSIGRNTETNSSSGATDIDLGPAKVVSRQHAAITYNLEARRWELRVLGRNGARVDGNKVPVGEQATPLHSGAIIEVGGTQMMFILPEQAPKIAQKMVAKCLDRYDNKRSGLKSFQIYDKGLTQSPSAVSATSLQSNLDQDLSREEAKDIKPPYSYATMITQAILSNEDGVMSLAEIYAWISSHYAYYKYSKTGWQNSIRHNLSLNKAFEKVPRRPNEPGKGMKWQISDAYKEEFMSKISNGSISKNRRGSSVSRQLHLHLATHKALPESKRRESSIESQLHHNQVEEMRRYEMSAPNSTSLSSDQSSGPQTSQPSSHSSQNQMPMPNMNSVSNISMPNAPQNAPPNPSMPNPHPNAPPDDMSYYYQKNLKLNQPYNQRYFPWYKAESPRQETPKLPKVGANLFTLPPPDHSRSNSYTQEFEPDLQMGFTSPKKIAQIEAFTPERGKPVKVPVGNQSSPAFWNFVQFSTPNGEVRKGSEDEGSPSVRKKELV